MALREPAADSDGQIVILVDGLDELRYRTSEEPLVGWLSGVQLPANVRLVLTSRPADAEVRAFCGKREAQLQELAIAEDDPRVRRDVVEYARELALPPEFASRAHGNIGSPDLTGAFLTTRCGPAQCRPMASYSVNEQAVARARELIDARHYVLDSDWGDAQPRAAAENKFLESHSWDEYAQWHLGLTEGAADGTKARYAFVYGDFRRIHRTALIACVYRASEWRHKAIELAAHDLLQQLDKTTS
jgi:hypothetical protein